MMLPGFQDKESLLQENTILKKRIEYLLSKTKGMGTNALSGQNKGSDDEDDILELTEEIETNVSKGLNRESDINSMLFKIHETINKCTCIGLIDVVNKIKEAEYNALQFFEKKCPYCGKGVFDGHMRNKLNIDHFWPIAKGGQHVPWNVLPVCGRCNNKKKDHLPFEFLESDRYIACLNYLESVRNKYGNETQTCVEMIAQIKGSILNDAALPEHEAVKRLYNVFGLRDRLAPNLHAGEFDTLCRAFMEGAKICIKQKLKPTGATIVNRRPRLKNIPPKMFDDIVRVLRDRGEIRVVEIGGKTSYEPLT